MFHKTFADATKCNIIFIYAFNYLLHENCRGLWTENAGGPSHHLTYNAQMKLGDGEKVLTQVFSSSLQTLQCTSAAPGRWGRSFGSKGMSFWMFITLVLNTVKISCISTYVVALPIQRLLILIQPIYGILRSKRRIEVFPVTVWFQVLGRNPKGGKNQGSVSRSLRMAESMAISGWLPYSLFYKTI